jgi:FtsP/CotA-like multicopper oxidase with cupredoxin domain
MVAAAVAQDKEHLSHMGGLVLGIRVKPRGPQPPEQPISQTIRLLVRSRANVYGEDVGYGFVRGDAPEAAMRDSFSVPGPTLELTRGKRVAVTIVNQSHEAAAIHWHGIELESYNDGVAGWSGDTRQTTKPIPPGGTLYVWFTPPRSGTFIYHTHAHGPHQLSSGMYSALLVVPDRRTFDSDTEKVLLLGGSGPISASFAGAPLELNRSTNPAPMALKVGTTYRFRLIDISPNDTAIVSIRGDAGLVQWRAISKDGAELPPIQATARAASQQLSVGETYDFEYRPAAPAELRLEVRVLGSDMLTTQLVNVTK